MCGEYINYNFFVKPKTDQNLSVIPFIISGESFTSSLFVRIGGVLFSICMSFFRDDEFYVSWLCFTSRIINCQVTCQCEMFGVHAVNHVVLDTAVINFVGMGRYSQELASLGHLISYFGITLHTSASDF